MNKKNINRIVIINILSTILIKAVSIVTAPIISRLLGADNYGIVSLYTTWVTIIEVVFSLQVVGTFAIARNEYSADDQASYQSSCFGLTICSFLTLSVFAFVVNNYIPKNYQIAIPMLVCALIQAFGLNCIQILNTRFTYEYEANKNLAISVSSTLAISVLSIVLILIMPDNMNYYGRIFGYVIVYMVAIAGTVVYMFRIGKVFYKKKYWRFCLSLSIPIIAHNLSSIVMGYCDVLMINQFMSYTDVGIYSLASYFTNILNTIQMSLNHSWLPFYFDYLREEKKEDLYNHARNYMVLFTGITFGFILLSGPVYQIFASKEYWVGESYILFFVIGHYFSFLYSFPVNFEFYSKQTKLVAACTFVSAVINVILNYFFIKNFGGHGAVVATAIANVFLFAFHQISASRFIKNEKYPLDIKFFLPFIMAVLSFTCIYHFIKSMKVICVLLAVMDGIYLLLRIKKNKSIL